MSKLDQARIHLLELVAKRGTNLASVSRAIGRNHAYLHQFINRGSPRQLSETERDKLGAYFSVSPESFRSVPKNRSVDRAFEGPRKRRTASRKLQIQEYDASAAWSENLLNSGREKDGLRAIDHWTLPRSFASGFLENLDSLAIVRVAGDSAEPEYQAGERILVDRSQVTPSPPGIYLLWDGFGLILKRVEVIFGGGIPVKLRVSSINQAYETCEQALNGVRIFGRVVGKWQWK